MKRLFIPALLLLALILSACSATKTLRQAQDDAPPQSDIEPDPASTNESTPNLDSATRTDAQGAIIFEVTPPDYTVSADTLAFDIVLTTHSIDLSMDLATVSTLSTDTGITVPSALWDAPRGGHHVEGKLIFPAMVDEKPILEGATKLILTIIDVDAPSRVFEWELK
ncbi:MAG: hypothetical protein C4557_09365 [Anaerolineaceae bacterium]|jgi:hypothetical protein|nr:MAG: hypothetical protein C4557_09365 [Anaerolineaceae bacterium]